MNFTQMIIDFLLEGLAQIEYLPSPSFRAIGGTVINLWPGFTWYFATHNFLWQLSGKGLNTIGIKDRDNLFDRNQFHMVQNVL